MNTHNDVELFQAGEASEDVKNSIQMRLRKLECQNLYTLYCVFRARWGQTLKKTMDIKTISARKNAKQESRG
jgi:hypothetical protein